MKITRKFNGKIYKRGISAYVYKKDAEEKAQSYRHWGIPARVVPTIHINNGRKRRVYYVYVLKAAEKDIRKNMARSMWI